MRNSAERSKPSSQLPASRVRATEVPAEWASGAAAATSAPSLALRTRLFFCKMVTLLLQKVQDKLCTIGQEEVILQLVSLKHLSTKGLLVRRYNLHPDSITVLINHAKPAFLPDGILWKLLWNTFLATILRTICTGKTGGIWLWAGIRIGICQGRIW